MGELETASPERVGNPYCPPLPAPSQVMIREKNPEGFLSAAEIPLFKLYMVMSACFLAAGIIWVSILCKNT